MIIANLTPFVNKNFFLLMKIFEMPPGFTIWN
jgi:hypothetical protein